MNTRTGVARRGPTAWLGGMIEMLPAELVRRRLLVLGVVSDIILALLVIVAGDGGWVGAASSGFLLLAAALRIATIGCTSPLLALFWLWSMVYIEIPCALFGSLPDRFPVDHGLSIQLPKPSTAAVLEALAHLACCYCASILGLKANFRRWSGDWPVIRPGRVTLVAALMLAVSVVYDRFRDAVPGLEVPAVQSILEFMKIVGSDTAIVAFFITYFTTSRGGCSEGSQSRLVVFALVSCGFVGLHTFNGSKGAIAVALFLVFGLPLAFALVKRGACIIVPSVRGILLAGVFALPLFAVAEQLRVDRKYGSEFSAEATEPVVIRLVSGELAETAALRVSVSYLRYLAVVASFRDGGQDASDRADHYIKYCGRSFVNLMLPGTPYPDQYSPSSMVLEPLLVGEPLFSGVEQELLRERLNTQPTTLFGFLYIVLGWWSPLAVFVLCLGIGRAFSASGPVLAAFSSMLLLGALGSYGMEVAVQLAISFGLTFAAMIWCAKESTVRRKSARRSSDIRTAVLVCDA